MGQYLMTPFQHPREESLVDHSWEVSSKSIHQFVRRFFKRRDKKIQKPCLHVPVY